MSDKKGLLISFDGVDSSGKETQAQSLVDRLRYIGWNVKTLQSPDYTTESGKELKARLQGKMGDWEKFPWDRKMGLFASNRAEHRQEVLESLKKGDIIVYDRYIPSSVAFITVEALTAQENEMFREDVRKAVERLEYQDNKMPKEDVSIFLDVPPRVSAGLLEQRKEKLSDEDEYTDHLHIQERLYSEYEHMCSDNPNRFMRIGCVEEGQLLGVAEVGELVWEGLLSRFPFLEHKE